MRSRRLLILCLSSLVMWGCGSASDPPPPASQLAAQVVSVRLAATAGDIERASAELSELRALVDRLEKAGVLPSDRGDRIRVAADEVEEQLGLWSEEAGSGASEDETESEDEAGEDEEIEEDDDDEEDNDHEEDEKEKHKEEKELEKEEKEEKEEDD